MTDPGAKPLDALPRADFELLAILGSAHQPQGARVVAREMRDRGFTISEATVSRMFKSLDERGWTRSAGAKGRVLTQAGREVVATWVEDRRRGRDLGQALNVRSVEQLLDLLRARRGVESEVARAAATEAGDAEIARLRDLVEGYDAGLARGENPLNLSLEFHRALGRYCGNDLLSTLCDTLLGERLDFLELVLDVITVDHGTHDQTSPAHAKVLDAVARRDPEAAEAAMREHLSRLIVEVEAFAAGESSATIFPRLLDLVTRTG
ncbi:hypothetical protein C1I98_12965 [Spongiactinospora gelatinilytica]|uniref:GntR C-terminal domain-containing protein n=1 Tax=Spongiactinospora gelatinilytica TaxID=2666298 RepID=A0A2W2GET9_9ACTN|nr:FCD domain-containing protein [Spongiactinospora gelatinilytica]PZG48106.1 hypothetical protein C1I98_12965 [Spongiactinospora gelatinilytica]